MRPPNGRCGGRQRCGWHGTGDVRLGIPSFGVNGTGGYAKQGYVGVLS